MKKIQFASLLILSFFLSHPLFAQHPSCDGLRYLTPVFSGIDSTLDLQFGSNDNAWSFNTDLFLDIYEPAGDTVSQRPALVFAFGEGFLSGNREDVAGICRSFARHGFVVANIDYRKYPGLFFTDSSQTVDAAIRATQDMKAAIRYLREDAATQNNFRIDPDYIFAGGISSGAIAACYTAYLDSLDPVSPVIQTLLNDNGGLEGNSNNLQRSSEVAGVLNWSGGLKDDEMMDANDPPIYSAHDTGDGVVPFGSGRVVVGLGVTIFFEGSGTLQARANSLNIWNDLDTFSTNTHVSYVDIPTDFLTVFQGSLAMMYEVLCPGNTTAVLPDRQRDFQLWPNPASSFVQIKMDADVQVEEIEIINQVGQRIWKSSSRNGSRKIDLRDVPNGVCLLVIKEASGAVTARRFLVQH